MQYFYLLNNKDIYGINGRFFGPSLNVCDCVDYFKQIGVPEGTSMDLTFGGFNGCYVYANNSLIKTLPSCGYVPLSCEAVNNTAFGLSTCTCVYNSSTINSNYIQLSPDLASSTTTIKYQMYPNLTYIDNSTERTLSTIIPNQYYYPLAYSQIYNPSLNISYTYYVRIKKLCSNGLWSPWSTTKSLTLRSYQTYPSCSGFAGLGCE